MITMIKRIFLGVVLAALVTGRGVTSPSSASKPPQESA